MQLNSIKTMHDAIKYVKSDGKVLVSAQVHHSQSVRKKELMPWVSISSNKTIIAGHCQCTARFGDVCCHVGAVLYSVFSATSLTCTALINKIPDLNTLRKGEKYLKKEKNLSKKEILFK
ncbi:hypothetical protein GHT06_020142 [Daphnia sinensis]|uniref:SWIM-type domain-containing protein n=1 Tax=Daphnia sinensis TaxID=1820382 RepID=A0AAD5PTQ3_9CRUS|nr:hypothetical protein GHT06_020142 [Daphnia sinensis]